MPHSSDDPASLPPAEGAAEEAPLANPPDDAVADLAEAAGADSEAPGATPADETVPTPRRRRRRRRRPPPESAPASDGGEAHAAEEPATSEPATVVESGQIAVPDAGQPPKLHRRRRRRRGPPRNAGAAPETASADGQAEASAAEDQPARSSEEPRNAPGNTLSREGSRRSRRRMPRVDYTAGVNQQGAAADAGTAFRQNPRTPRRPGATGMRDRGSRPAEPREGDARSAGRGEHRGARADQGPGNRNRADRERGPRGRGPGDRRLGRGREASQRTIERKLYALESVVDRGFEDVDDEAAESASRRIHWTILKRTVADQKSGKPMSATYVLQREGIESEYPNLGAARLAVNKTIMHPEKLTMSKAEHAAAKK